MRNSITTLKSDEPSLSRLSLYASLRLCAGLFLSSSLPRTVLQYFIPSALPHCERTSTGERHIRNPTTYRALFTFLLPLVVTVIVQEFSAQVLNTGMARMPSATETLASYGLAWGIVAFLSSSLIQMRQLSLVLVDSADAYRRARYFLVAFGLALAALVASLARGPFGIWVFEVLHGVDSSLAAVVQDALFWLIPLPLLRGLSWFHSGLLLRVRRTDLVSVAILAGIGASIAAVFGLLPLPMIQQKPIRLPLWVTYAGLCTELGVVLWAYRRHVPRSLPQLSPEKTLTHSQIFHFFWPLALIMAIQGMSRPLINLFVSRGPNASEALAVLTVVYALAHVPYGWLNEIRNLPPAFKDEQDSVRPIRRFALGCGLFSFFSMVLLFWTPIKYYLLQNLIGVEPELAIHCGMPLIIFSFFPLTVMIRAYLHGVALVERRTKALAPSAPSRIAAIAVLMNLLPASRMHGATRGVASLLGGFIAETSVVWWRVHIRGPKDEVRKG